MLLKCDVKHNLMYCYIHCFSIDDLISDCNVGIHDASIFKTHVLDHRSFRPTLFHQPEVVTVQLNSDRLEIVPQWLIRYEEKWST